MEIPLASEEQIEEMIEKNFIQDLSLIYQKSLRNGTHLKVEKELKAIFDTFDNPSHAELLFTVSFLKKKSTLYSHSGQVYALKRARKEFIAKIQEHELLSYIAFED